MKKRIIIALFVIFALCFSSCGRTPAYKENTFVSMDTIISVKIAADTQGADEIFKKCREITERVRSICDADDEKSVLSLRNAGETVANDELDEILDICREVSEATGGAFNPSVRDLILAWREAEKSGILPERRQQDRPTFANDGTGRDIDLGGVAKGYAEELVVDYLKESGVEYGIVSFGGNVAVFGDRPGGGDFTIAVRDPDDPSGVVGRISLAEGYVSVSGDYERYYEINDEKYHHVLDPGTGYPSDSGLRSVAVVTSGSGAGALGDALATALLVMGEEDAMKLYERNVFSFEAVFITENGDVHTTPGLSEAFTQSQNRND